MGSWTKHQSLLTPVLGHANQSVPMHAQRHIFVVYDRSRQESGEASSEAMIVTRQDGATKVPRQVGGRLCNNPFGYCHP